MRAISVQHVLAGEHPAEADPHEAREQVHEVLVLLGAPRDRDAEEDVHRREDNLGAAEAVEGVEDFRTREVAQLHHPDDGVHLDPSGRRP